LEEKSPGFDERTMEDLIVPSTPPASDSDEMQGNLLNPEYGLQSHGNQVE
jgi:hypothetical protein